MPLAIPNLDDRTYQELLDEALARIPVHNPEWTNFNRSDPGVTLIELFAFLTENLLYRSNQIPERNRRKFLSLLGVPLQAASSSQGMVAFSNERGPLETITLNSDLEVRAGQVPFRTVRGLDVLPVETKLFIKRKIDKPDAKLVAYYQQLYASFLGTRNLGKLTPQLYESVPLPPRDGSGVDLGSETADRSLWIALLARPREDLETARKAIANKTLSLGIVPVLTKAEGRMGPGRRAAPEAEPLLQYKIPRLPVSGGLPSSTGLRQPDYKPLDAVETADVLAGPGTVEITLPGIDELRLWNNLDPLEAGVGDLPPALDDTNLADRVITWLRVTSTAAVQAKLLWVGINATMIVQRAEVADELLPDGTGEPDLVVTLAKTPVIPGTVRLKIASGAAAETWAEIDDLTAAGPEVPVPDLRLPPGSPQPVNTQVKVFALNAESGEVRFGDGTRGARPPFGATIRASYAYGVGAAGNVGAGAISTSPALPAGLKVSNPVPTWGGAAAETVSDGEKQITRYLQHRDRLVSVADFLTVVLRTPGVDIGRVEVLPAFHPSLSPNEPGDAPGVVTLMVIPRYDPLQPDAPLPDRLFVETVCAFLDSRRLVTTEVLVRGPSYKGIWVSAGIDVIAGVSIAQVREAVKAELLRFLAPLPPDGVSLLETQTALLTAPQEAAAQGGWPLRKPVNALELAAVASRVPGVLLVKQVLVAEQDAAPPADGQIPMKGLELPRVFGISVAAGDPMSLDDLRGMAAAPVAATEAVFLPLPVVPEECR